MDATSSLVSQIVVRAVDQATAVLERISGEMDQVAAAAGRTDAAYAAALKQVESYEVRVAGLSASMAKAAGGTTAAGATGAEAATVEKTAAQTRALATADMAVATNGAKAAEGSKAASAAADKQAISSAKAESSVKGLSGVMTKIGGVFIALAAGSAYFAAKFSSDMELVKTQAHASQQEVEGMSTSLLRMATQVGSTPDQLATGLYHIESAGFRGAQALKILRTAAEGAAIGQAKLEDVTQALIALTASHIKGITGETQAMSILNGIVGAGDMRMQQLADALSTGVVASAKTFGLSITDIGAALATMGDNLMQGSMAATRLRMDLALMAAPSSTAQKALASIGLGATQLADDMRKPQGLLVAIQDLKKHLQDTGMTASQQGEVISHAFGGGRSSAPIELMIEQTGRLQAKYDVLGVSAKKFGSDWAATQQTVVYQMHQFEADLEVMAIQLGRAFLPAATAIMHALTPVFTAFAQFASTHTSVVVAFTAIGIAVGALGLALKAGLAVWGLYKDAATGYLAIKTLIVGALIAEQGATDAETAALTAQTPILDVATIAWEGLWYAILGPIGLIVAAIAGVIAVLVLLYQHSATFRDLVNNLASALQEKLVGAFNLLGDVMSGIGHLLAQVGSGIGDVGGGITSFIQQHLEPLISKVQQLVSAFQSLPGPLKAAILAATGPVGQIATVVQGAQALGSALDKAAHEHDKIGEAGPINRAILAQRGYKETIDQSTDAQKKQTRATEDYSAVLTKLTSGAQTAYNEALAHATLDILHHGAATEADVAALVKARDALDRYNQAQTEAANIGTTTANILIPEAARVEKAWIDAAQKTQAAWVRIFQSMKDGAISAAQAMTKAASAQGAGARQHLGALAGYAGVQGQANQIALEQGVANWQVQSSGAQIVQQTGAGGIAGGMSNALNGFLSAVGKLPSSLQGAMAPITARFETLMRQATENYARSVRTEDDRHIAALAAIQKQHEQGIAAVYASAGTRLQSLNQSHESAVSQHIQSYNQAASQRIQGYRANMAAANQQEKSLLQTHEGNLKSLHSDYVAKLAGENAKQQAATTAAYQKAVAHENSSFSSRQSLIQKHIAGLTKAFQDGNAGAAKTEETWLRRNDAAYKGHADKIRSALQSGIDAQDKAERNRVNAENQRHAAELAALKKAFGDHAKAIENALKAGAKPPAIWASLSSSTQTQTTNATSALDLAELEGAKHLKSYVEAVVQAAAAQKKMADAVERGARAVAAATGNWAAVMQDKATKLSAAVDTATANIVHDILVRGSATVADIAQLIKAEKAQETYTAAQARAALDVARATGQWSVVLQAQATKLQTAVDNATAKITLDIENRGKASKADVDALVKAELAQQKFTEAQNKAALIVAKATGQWQVVLQSVSTKISTDLSNALAKVTLDIIQHGRASDADVASLVKAQQAQDAYTAAQQQAAQIVAQATGQWKTVLDGISTTIQTNLDNATSKLTLDFLNSGKASEADIASAAQARQAQDKLTQASWDASFAMADAATQSQMLAARFQSIVSGEQSNEQSYEALKNAMQAVTDQAAANVVDAINAGTTAIKDQTAVISAAAAVSQAQMQGQLAAIQDQGGIIQAQAQIALAGQQYQSDLIASQTTIQGTAAAAQAAATLRDDQMKIQIAQDQLQIAVDTYALHQIESHWAIVQAQDQLKIAQDQRSVDAANAAATASIDQLKLKIAADNLAVTQAQAKIAVDQLAVQADIASSLGSVTDYGSMISADTAALQSTQQQALADNQALAAAQNQANIVAAQGQQQIALDQMALAQDQAAGQNASLAQQQKIATDQNKLASDQAAEQVAAQNTTNNLLQQQIDQNQAAADAMISALEQLLTDSRSAVSARQGTPAAGTTSGFFNGIAGDAASTVTPR